MLPVFPMKGKEFGMPGQDGEAAYAAGAPLMDDR
jgi:hypothetical protein